MFTIKASELKHLPFIVKTLSKMAERNLKRRQMRKVGCEVIHLESFVADYFQHKHSSIYSEAKQFYEKLRHRYPSKRNLKKTDEYKVWKINHNSSNAQSSEQPTPSSPEHGYTDNLELRIPLMNNDSIQKNPASNPETIQTLTEEEIHPSNPASNPETIETRIEEEIHPSNPASNPETIETRIEEEIHPTLTGELDTNIMDEIIADLRSDPDINRFMVELEHEMYFEEYQTDIDGDTDDTYL